MHKILCINPGSTSTKIAIFENETCLKEISIRHTKEELSNLKNVEEDFYFRKKLVEQALEENQFDLDGFSAISCRGGIIKSIPSGTYLVDENVLFDAKNSVLNHPSNLACMIGYELGQKHGLHAYITDPPTTFEATEVSKITGNPSFQRVQRFHALNHKAVAKQYAKDQGLKYEDLNLIVAHIGGGISVGVHERGRVIDVNDAMDEGPFSPERSGSLPVFQLVRASFKQGMTQAEMESKLRGDAGIKAYLGTSDVREVIKEVEKGNMHATLIFDAFVYQIAKEIGAMSTVVSGNVDQIIITGGVAYNEQFILKLKERVSFIADVSVYPGEEEMKALNQAVLNVLKGLEQVKEY